MTSKGSDQTARMRMLICVSINILHLLQVLLYQKVGEDVSTVSVGLFVLMLNLPVNYFTVILGRFPVFLD